MTATLVTGIGELVTFDPAHPGPLGIVNDAAVLSVEGRVVWTGGAAPPPPTAADPVKDEGGAAVKPRVVQKHTHHK
ncbi:MAG: imidazolonepropionase, partial [Leifsonia sp.]